MSLERKSLGLLLFGGAFALIRNYSLELSSRSALFTIVRFAGFVFGGGSGPE